MPFLAFDLEIARILPDFNAWRQHRPLGIACAATLDEAGTLRLWTNPQPNGTPAPQLTQPQALALLDFLAQQQQAGRHVVTWNGLAFDFDILGEEAANQELASHVAWHHADLMFAFLCVRGHRLSLQQAAMACHSRKGAAGIEGGAQAPVLWAQGEHDRVLAYLEQDVRATADVAQYLLAKRGFTWTNSKGRPTRFDLPTHVRSLEDLAVHNAIKWPEPDTSWMATPPRRSDLVAWMSSAS
jgi:hypothetical protein